MCGLFWPSPFLPRLSPKCPPPSVVLPALPVDDTRRGSALAALRRTCVRDQDTIYPPPNIAIAPIVKVMLNRRVRRKGFRQSPPLAAGRKKVEDRIPYDAKAPLRWTPNVTPLRQQWAQQDPLLSRPVACIAQPVAAIMVAGGCGASH